MLHRIAGDIRFALRQFAKRPAFTAAVVVVLALGLGANTAIFSVVNALLLRPLPYPSSDRIVELYERMHGKSGDEGSSLSPGNYADWRAQSKAFDEIAASINVPANLSSESREFEPERVNVCYCSANFTTLLGVAPLVGRAIRPEEDRFGDAKVALISYDLWRQRLGETPDAIGRTIRLDGDAVQVIGVMPRGFHYPSYTTEIWTPLMSGLAPQTQTRRDLHFLRVIGRLHPGITREQATADLDVIIGHIRNVNRGVAMGDGAIVIPLRDAIVGNVQQALVILLGAVGCVLLIVCVNVANLLLTRSSARARELCIRCAIGAAPGEILRQLLTESVLLALAGGAAGLALAAMLTPILTAHVPGQTAMLASGAFGEPRVFLFSFLIALTAGVAVGFYPAWRSSRTDVASGLRESTQSSTSSPWQVRFRGALIVTEVALSLVLLTAAGLLFHSFTRLLEVNPGMRTDHVLTFRLSLPNTYKTAANDAAFYRQIEERLKVLPGVASTGLSSCPPLSGSCNVLFFYREDRPFVPGQFLAANESAIDPSYLVAGGIPLLRGRSLTLRDGIGSDEKNPKLGSILVNEAMAREFFPGENPIGKRIFYDFQVQRSKLQGLPIPKYEIVGVVGNVRANLDRDPQPQMYLPLLDVGGGGVTVLIHTVVAPESVTASALSEIQKLDPSLAVYDIGTMEDLMGQAAADRRFLLLLFTAFAGLAVFLATVGLYSVLSNTVVQRRAEIGVRMALGASATDVSRLVVCEGMKPAALGVALGLLAALVASRVLKSLLFGIGSLDPLTFTLGPLLLLAVSLLACYVPSLRATRIDPMLALRSQ